MSLYHDFLLLREGEVDYTEYTNYLGSKSDVKIHDDLLYYISDTLMWVPSINPANPTEWQGYGLNTFGPTVINQEGSEIFHHVIESWAHLFSKAPKSLDLKGVWITRNDEGVVSKAGHYDLKKLDRDVLVENLRDLAIYANHTCSGEFFILHLGI